jgi:hypothetical protein
MPVVLKQCLPMEAALQPLLKPMRNILSETCLDGNSIDARMNGVTEWQQGSMG